MGNERLARLAGDLYTALVTLKRDSGETIYVLKDGSPEWMKEAVKAAHGTEMFPDDYRYEFINEAAGAIRDYDGDWDNAINEMECDVYTHDRLKWLASHLNRPNYCDEVCSDFGADTFFGKNGQGIVQLIGEGQLREKFEIAMRLKDFLLEKAKEDEEQEEQEATCDDESSSSTSEDPAPTVPSEPTDTTST